MNHSPDVSLLLPALLAAQQGFPPIPKSQHVQVTSRTGRSYAYDFAPLDEILAAVMPVLAAHGLLITSASVPSEGGMCVSTRLWHISGQYLESLVPAGAYEDCKGQGSAISYARRFSHLSLLNLAGQDDEDGSLSNGDHIEPRKKGAPSVPVHGNGHTPPAPEPDATLEHPTEGHLAALRKLAITVCMEELEVFEGRLRRAMGVPTHASVAPKLLTRTMTMAQYMELFAYYRRLEAQLEKSRKEEVPDGTQPGSQEIWASPEPQPSAGDTTPDPPPAAPEPDGAVVSSSAASEPDAADRDRDRLRAEVAQWSLRVHPEEVEHVIQHNPYSRARQLLWKCRRQDTAA